MGSGSGVSSQVAQYDLVEELARLAAGLNPVVRDIRKIKQKMEE